MKPRIAILASAFDPRLNYQESVTARTLHRSGYDVRVFTTTAPIVRKDISYPEVDAASGIAITRSSKFIRIKNTFIPRDPDTVALRDTASAVRADDDWMPALLTIGDGLLIASLRNRS